MLAATTATATASARDELVTEYATTASREAPAFAGFAAARGESFHRKSFAGGKPETSACTSCHSSDPRTAGRTPAGKAIEPLAVAVNPARYTDPAKVEKWFRRNCHEVLGRECTAQEKGDWLSYMIGRQVKEPR